jgi:hypothetical protein
LTRHAAKMALNQVDGQSPLCTVLSYCVRLSTASRALYGPGLPKPRPTADSAGSVGSGW